MNNTQLKSRKIHGKNYVEVNERLRFFRQNYPGHSICTEIIKITDDQVVIGAKVLDPDGKILSTGHAHEEKASSNINRTSYVENGETSAIGRALGIFGIGIEGGVASAEEVDMAIAQQNKQEVRSFALVGASKKAAPAEAPEPAPAPAPDESDDSKLLWTAQELFGSQNPNLDAYLVHIGWLKEGEWFMDLPYEKLEYAIKGHVNLMAEVEKFALTNNSDLRSAVGAAIAKGGLS